ncbi:MAG: hypothetical protein LBG96_11420 [Tannerella sp.]|nr:hypothetical protein [Tannerella sp.]
MKIIEHTKRIKEKNELIKEDVSGAQLLHEGYTFIKAHVVWAVRGGNGNNGSGQREGGQVVVS